MQRCGRLVDDLNDVVSPHVVAEALIGISGREGVMILPEVVERADARDAEPLELTIGVEAELIRAHALVVVVLSAGEKA